MSWPWKNWSWHGKWEDEKKESEATQGQNWWSEKDTKHSEYTGELTDQDIEATVITKVNLQKRKQSDPDTQDQMTTKAALREKIFAQHGASTLMKEDLEKMRRTTKTQAQKKSKGKVAQKEQSHGV